MDFIITPGSTLIGVNLMLALTFPQVRTLGQVVVLTFLDLPMQEFISFPIQASLSQAVTAVDV